MSRGCSGGDGGSGGGGGGKRRRVVGGGGRLGERERGNVADHLMAVVSDKTRRRRRAGG